MLIKQTPADYVTREVARLTEYDTSLDERAALHATVTSLAQVIADDIAAGSEAYAPTVARYIEARDRYQAIVLRWDRDVMLAAEMDRVFDLDPPEYQPDEDSER